MKKLIVAALLVVGMTTFAQEKNAKPLTKISEKHQVKQKADENLMKLTEELNLTDAQQKQMAGIIAEQSTKREAAAAERKASIEQKTKMTAEEYKQRSELRKADREAYKEKVKSVLTAEQYAKWEQFNKDRKATKAAQ